MSMIDAFRFLAVCRNDENFRGNAYLCPDPDSFHLYIAQTGYSFNEEELEDAFFVNELRCKDEYEADEIKQLAQWYRIMTISSPSTSCGTCHRIPL